MFLRPITSDRDDQPMRPPMLPNDSRATNPAAAEADTGADECAKKSVIIGAARSRMPMPAVTFMHSTIHRHQNCGVARADFADTCTVPAGLVSAGTAAAGLRSARRASPSAA